MTNAIQPTLVCHIHTQKKITAKCSCSLALNFWIYQNNLIHTWRMHIFQRSQVAQYEIVCNYLRIQHGRKSQGRGGGEWEDASPPPPPPHDSEGGGHNIKCPLPHDFEVPKEFFLFFFAFLLACLSEKLMMCEDTLSRVWKIYQKMLKGKKVSELYPLADTLSSLLSLGECKVIWCNNKINCETFLWVQSSGVFIYSQVLWSCCLHAATQTH